jgi:ketosteroid isomerase-like protein
MRKRLLHLTPLLIAVLISIWTTQALSADSDTDAATKAVNAFAEAWNRHDMQAFGALFAIDADFVNVTGQLWRGRKEIQRRHAFLHGAIPREDVPEARPDAHGIFRSSTYHFDRIDVRLLRPDLAIAHGAWTMQGDARTAEPRRGMMTFTLTRHGDDWLYDAVQNTEINRLVN